jgi:LacI family transcriptional regulator
VATDGKTKTVTIVNVAETAGVSVSTASRALSAGGGVRPRLEQRVREAASALGYRPNLAARTLRQSKTLSLGIIFNNLDSLVQLDLVRGLGAVAQEKNYSLLVTNARYDRSMYRELIDRMFERGIDGLFLSSPVDLGDSLACYRRASVPVIALSLNQSPPGLSLPIVCTNEEAAVQDAVRRLADLGHKSVACLLGNWESSRSRLIESACALRSMPVLARGVEVGPLAWEGAQIAGIARNLLLGADRPTVLFTNQSYVPHLMPLMREIGLTVPDDLSIVSFGDSPWLKTLSPSVATIRSDNEEIGWLAGTIMIQALQSGMEPTPLTKITQAEWIERASVGPPRLSEAVVRDDAFK